MEWCYESLALFVDQTHFQTVALQFPHEYLEESVSICKYLRKKLPNTEFYILADETYGSCCIDGITAKHVNPQLVVHFGDACLTPVTFDFKILYVFNRLNIDLDILIDKCTAELPEDSHILVVYESHYYHLGEQIEAVFKDKFSNSEVAHIVPPPHCYILCKDGEKSSQHSEHLKFGRVMNMKNIDNKIIIFITNGDDINSISSFKINFINSKFYSFNTASNEFNIDATSHIRLLGKRIHLIQRVREASSIGIIVNGPALKNSLDAITKLKKMIKDCGKKCYVVSVGRITPSKLGNFSSIHAWVILSCFRTSFLDSKEFYRPIINPNECYMACTNEETHCFSTDFQDYINLYSSSTPKEQLTLCPTVVEAVEHWKGLENEEVCLNPAICRQGLCGVADEYTKEVAIK